MILAQIEIDKQIAKIERMIDKRGTAGAQLDDFLGEEKTRLYGMLQIYWLFGGKEYSQYKLK